MESKSETAQFDYDPASPCVAAMHAIHMFLITDSKISPDEAYGILLCAAGEMVAQYFVGDSESLIADAPNLLRSVITNFTEKNPHLVADKWREMN